MQGVVKCKEFFHDLAATACCLVDLHQACIHLKVICIPLLNRLYEIMAFPPPNCRTNQQCPTGKMSDNDVILLNKIFLRLFCATTNALCRIQISSLYLAWQQSPPSKKHSGVLFSSSQYVSPNQDLLAHPSKFCLQAHSCRIRKRELFMLILLLCSSLNVWCIMA